MPYKGGVQLLPQTRQQTIRRVVRGNKVVYWGLALGAIVLIAHVTLSAYEASLRDEIGVADGQLRTQESQRDKDQETALLSAQKQSRLMGTLLRQHLYWSDAFALIEDLMQSNVRLKSIGADASGGTVQFTAVGPSYAAVARQLASFISGDGVLDVELGNAKAGDEGIEFSGEIRINTQKVLFQAPLVPTGN